MPPPIAIAPGGGGGGGGKPEAPGGIITIDVISFHFSTYCSGEEGEEEAEVPEDSLLAQEAPNSAGSVQLAAYH